MEKYKRKRNRIQVKTLKKIARAQQRILIKKAKR